MSLAVAAVDETPRSIRINQLCKSVYTHLVGEYLHFNDAASVEVH